MSRAGIFMSHLTRKIYYSINNTLIKNEKSVSFYL